MDMGFIPGQKIELEEKRLGLWIVNMVSENGNQEQTFALRPEELDRICLKELL
jgi:Fe2+ transport system protein FeoA